MIEYIKQLSKSEVNDEYTIVICFFFKPESYGDSVIKHQTTNQQYLDFFKKNNKVFNIFITERGYVYKNKRVFEDKENRIKELLFNYPFEYGNYIVIKPDRSFKKEISEYNSENIIAYIKK